MLFVLDTTCLIDHLRNVEHVTARLEQIGKERHEAATTTLNVAELYSGLLPSEEARTETLISALTILPVDISAARRAGKWRYAYRRQGTTLALVDMLVAAIAFEHGATLLTANTRHFPMAELKVEELPSRPKNATITPP